MLTGYYAAHTGFPRSDQSSCSDPDSISSHVYNAYRLNVIRACITASGIVDRVLQEADGDYHVRLALDPQYSNLTNGRQNSRVAKGKYVLGQSIFLSSSEMVDLRLAADGSYRPRVSGDDHRIRNSINHFHDHFSRVRLWPRFFDGTHPPSLVLMYPWS